MNIGTIFEKTTPVSFEYEGEKIHLDVRSAALTPRLAQMFRNLDERPLEIATALASLVAGWDLDYNGEPFSPSVENFERLPFDFIEKAITAINEVWMGKSQTPKVSGNGSAPAAKPEAARTAASQ